MINSPRIIVDLDDTATHLLPIWFDMLNKQHGLNADWQTIDKWDMSAAFPTLTREQIQEPLVGEELWDMVTPRQGAIEVLSELRDNGFEVFICTSTDYRNVKQKYEKVIRRHFPFIDWRHVIIASHKQLIDADYIIDDAPHNLVGGIQRYKILMDMPHNRNFPNEAHGIIRTNNWEQINACIKLTMQQRSDLHI